MAAFVCAIGVDRQTVRRNTELCPLQATQSQFSGRTEVLDIRNELMSFTLITFHYQKCTRTAVRRLEHYFVNHIHRECVESVAISRKEQPTRLHARTS